MASYSRNSLRSLMIEKVIHAPRKINCDVRRERKKAGALEDGRRKAARRLRKQAIYQLKRINFYRACKHAPYTHYPCERAEFPYNISVERWAVICNKGITCAISSLNYNEVQDHTTERLRANDIVIDANWSSNTPRVRAIEWFRLNVEGRVGQVYIGNCG
jgi:hypothetical protein